MNIKRGILIGALFWGIVFFEVSILMFGFKLDSSQTLYYLIHYLFIILLTIFAASLYYKHKKTKASAINGLWLGLILILTGILLDSIITIPLFVKDYSFLISLGMFGSYLLVILTVVVYSVLRNKR
jgi:hypothetical protein